MIYIMITGNKSMVSQEDYSSDAAGPVDVRTRVSL